MTPWTAAHQALLSSIISRSLLKFRSTESVMLSNHLILYHPLRLLPSVFSSISIFIYVCVCVYIYILPLKTLVLWENQINLRPFTQDTLSRNITFLAGASVLSLKTQNVSNSTSCSKMRRPSTICGYFGISSFFLPHTINQVTAECSEIEWLLDKLCDTAFITGKGKEKKTL